MHWTRTVYYRYCIFLRPSSFHNFSIMETIQNLTVVRRLFSCPTVTTLAKYRYIAVVVNWNRRSTSKRVTSMVAIAVSSGKTISTSSVRWRIYMDGLYFRVPRVCALSSVQSRGKWLKWHHQGVNWTLSDWNNDFFTDEYTFSQQLDDNRVRVWREQGIRNWTENITEHHAFCGGGIMICGQVFHWDMGTSCPSTAEILWRTYWIEMTSYPQGETVQYKSYSFFR